MDRKFILYKIYYQDNDDIPVYLGRTNQTLTSRLRGHFFKEPMHRTLGIERVSRIEYAECDTEADRNVYEIYYINLLKPPLNVDDKCKDKLNIRLPELEWHLWENEAILKKWKNKLSCENTDFNLIGKAVRQYREFGVGFARRLKIDGAISEDDYYDYKEAGEKLEKMHRNWSPSEVKSMIQTAADLDKKTDEYIQMLSQSL